MIQLTSTVSTFSMLPLKIWSGFHHRCNVRVLLIVHLCLSWNFWLITGEYIKWCLNLSDMGYPIFLDIYLQICAPLLNRAQLCLLVKFSITLPTQIRKWIWAQTQKLLKQSILWICSKIKIHSTLWFEKHISQ